MIGKQQLSINVIKSEQKSCGTFTSSTVRDSGKAWYNNPCWFFSSPIHL